MARRPTWLAWIFGAAAAAVVLVVADRITHDAATTGGWRMTLAASVLYGAALVGLGMVMLARTRTSQAAALLSAVTVWGIGWLAPALAVAPFEESGSALVMVGTGLFELPIAACTRMTVSAEKRAALSKNALEVMRENRGATAKTIDNLKQFLG